jgi:TPR repeat protein
MQKLKFAGWALAAALMTAAFPALAQQDDVPILRPKNQTTKPASATLLVTCDLVCNWKLDGVAKGRIETGGSAKAKVVLGQHVVVATTEEGLDKVQQLTEVKATGQKVVSLELKPIRDTRLKAEKEAKDKAAQAVRDEAAERFKEGQGLSDSKHYEDARLLYQKACDGEEMAGCDKLGKLYDNGQGVTRDYAQARTFYQKACDGGNMDGCDDLGSLYYYGRGVTLDYAQAHTLIQKACDGGSMEGCTDLGILYDIGHGVTQDYSQARTFYQKACNSRNMDGCFALGNLYDHGHGVTQDYVQARALYKKACDGGSMAGCANLGVIYYYGNGLTHDYAQAQSLFQKACDDWYMQGCTYLGGLYQNGQGVSRDYAQARALYQRACDGGYMPGCSSLGWLYQNGHGVAQDYAQARMLYKKACEGGMEKACTTLKAEQEEQQKAAQDRQKKEQIAQNEVSPRQVLEIDHPDSVAKVNRPRVLVWGDKTSNGAVYSTVKDALSGHSMKKIHTDFADVSSTFSYSETPAGWMAYSVFAVATITVTNTSNGPIEIGGTTQTLEAPSKKYFDKEQIGCSYIAYWSAPRQKKTQPLPSEAKGTIAPHESRQFSVIMHVHMSGAGVPDNAPDASNVIGAPVPVRYSIRVGSQDFVFPEEIPTQYTGDYSCRPVPER